MAKGIIAGRPGSSNPNGRIMVIEGAIDPTQPMAPGSVIKFNEITKANLGDVVTFDIDPATGMPVNITSVLAGKVITGDYPDQLVVSSGESVLISGHIEGNINVNGGILTAIEASHIEGKVQSKVDNSIIFIENKCHVEGKVEVLGVSIVSIKNSEIEGSVNTNGTVFTAVEGCIIHGSLQVLMAKKCSCNTNTVEGKINTPGC